MATRILVTSVGYDGFPMLLRSLKQSGYEVYGCDSGDVAARLILGVKHWWKCPRRNSVDFLKQLQDFCSVLKIDCIVPLSDEDQVYFAHRKFENDLIVPVMVNDLVALKKVRAKSSLYSFAESLGIKVPRWCFAKYFEVEHPFFEGERLCFKHDIGTSGRGMFEWKFRVNDPIFAEDGIVSEFLEGPEWCVDVLSWTDGIHKSVVRSKLCKSGGMTTVGQIVDRPDIAKLAEDLVSASKLVYITNVQFKEDSHGVSKLIDLNPRIPGTISFVVAAGVDMPHAAIQACLLGIMPDVDRPKIGMKLYKYWTEVYDEDTK